MTIDKHALRTPAGFDAAYRAYARRILIFLARRTYDPETALDLTAETFAQAFEARRRSILPHDQQARRRVMRELARHASEHEAT